MSQRPDKALRSAALFLLCALPLGTSLVEADDDAGGAAKVYNSERSPVKFSSPAEAAARVTAPEGFRTTLFAGEPDVRQPVALTTDARGRLWVVENYTYAEGALNFDLAQRDRILIFEDNDQDGSFDRRTVFWDDGQRLMSVEVGFGGVWVLAAPHLLFIPDGDGDDRPDGPPKILLDGWDGGRVRHNIVNGLRWGPDGWLYGRHGILATSYVGKPGTARSERTPINCGIWRYHPTLERFEVVAHGTTNPWGMDWDDHGQLFFVNTVIGHLWHVIGGAHYERMYGEDFNPYLYRLVPQTADHYHWDTREKWSDVRQRVSAATLQFGGGHAHSGLMVYLGDNWPAKYRGDVFTVNFHGRRINHDRLERKGSSYTATHEPDFVVWEDLWFRGIELIYGPDGGVYVADWSDVGECHENDGVHRTSGRIYKVVYKTPTKPSVSDLTQRSDTELVQLQLAVNDWWVRQARLLLYQRAARGQNMSTVHAKLKELYRTQKDVTRKLRAVWCLYVTGGLNETWLLQQLVEENEHLRTWAVKLLVDTGPPSATALARLTAQAARDPSGLVLLFLASALQRLPLEQRWPLAEALAGRGEYGEDRVFPLMLWYGIEPAVPHSPERASELLAASRIPFLRRSIAERLTDQFARSPARLGLLVKVLEAENKPMLTRDVLSGMARGLRGFGRVEAPDNWQGIFEKLTRHADMRVPELARELAVVFGDGRTTGELRRLVLSENVELSARRKALRALVDARVDGLLPLLRRLLDSDLARDAIRGLALFDDSETPSAIVKNFESFREPARLEAVNTLAARPSSARVLLAALADGVIERDDVSAFQLRQMRTFNDSEVNRRLLELWPQFRHTSEQRAKKVSEYADKLSAERLAAADRSQGRLLFARSCANCHRLFGDGGTIGPDLTGAQRTNIQYLLRNIVDPSAEVADGFRMSVVVVADGRVLNGVVVEETDAKVSVQTESEKVVLPKEDILRRTASQLSMMPERLLDVMSDDQVRDLIGYLMSPRHPPDAEQ